MTVINCGRDVENHSDVTVDAIGADIARSFARRRLMTTCLRLIACYVVLSTSALFAQDEGKSEAEWLEELTAAVASAESYQLWDAYQDLFAVARNDQLQSLQRHSNTSISIQAAWEAVLNTLTDEQRDQGRRPHDKQALSRFRLRRRSYSHLDTEMVGRSRPQWSEESQAEVVPQRWPDVCFRAQGHNNQS